MFSNFFYFQLDTWPTHPLPKSFWNFYLFTWPLSPVVWWSAVAKPHCRLGFAISHNAIVSKVLNNFLHCTFTFRSFEGGNPWPLVPFRYSVTPVTSCCYPTGRAAKGSWLRFTCTRYWLTTQHWKASVQTVASSSAGKRSSRTGRPCGWSGAKCTGEGDRTQGRGWQVTTHSIIIYKRVKLWNSWDIVANSFY